MVLYSSPSFKVKLPSPTSKNGLCGAQGRNDKDGILTSHMLWSQDHDPQREVSYSQIVQVWVSRDEREYLVEDRKGAHLF